MKHTPIQWGLFDIYARRIAGELSEKKPFDVLVPILRGGLPLATVLSYHLGIKDIEPIYWQTRDNCRSDLRLYNIVASFSNPLFVDDLIDSGKTLNDIADHIAGTVENLTAAVLIKRPSIEVKTFQLVYATSFDFEWIDFPWDPT